MCVCVCVCVRYLLELDCEGDPAWDCLSNVHRWMLRLLYNSKEEFQGTASPAGKFNPGGPTSAYYS